MQKKRKSVMRFEQVNVLCDEVLRNLPTATHGLVLLVGWRHADGKRVFRKSASELARIVGVSRRHMQTILDDLIEIGALQIVKNRQGTIPASHLITGQPRRKRGDMVSPETVASGEPQFATKQTLVVNCSSASGEL